jgi:hypothetical protein
MSNICDAFILLFDLTRLTILYDNVRIWRALILLQGAQVSAAAVSLSLFPVLAVWQATGGARGRCDLVPPSSGQVLPSVAFQHSLALVHLLQLHE